MAALCLTLAACKVGPDAPPVTEPPQADALLAPAGASAGVVSAQQQPVAQWWTAFRDPTLDALIAKSDEGNQTLMAAMANVRAAYASVGVSEADLWPTVGTGAQYTRTLTNIAQLAAAGVRVEPYNSYAYGVGMSAWEIDLWGGVRRQVEASKASAESTVDTLRDALVSVRAQVAASYLQVRTLQTQRAVLLDTRETLVKTRDLIQARFDAGTTNGLDVARAQADLDAMDAQVPQIDGGLSSAIASLAVLCGMTPSQLAPLVVAVAPLPAAPEIAGIGLPAQLIERRPDVRAAHQRLLAATAAIGATEAQRLPTLSLSGNFYIAANDVSGLGDLSNKAYSFGPSLSLPIFTAGRIDSAVRQARAEAEAALAQYRGTVISAIGDLSASVGDFVYARETRARADAALASAEAALVLAQQQFDAGVTDYSTLLDVQRAALDAQTGAVDAQAGVAQGFVSLQRALGAGWSDSDTVLRSAESSENQANETSSSESRKSEGSR